MPPRPSGGRWIDRAAKPKTLFVIGRHMRSLLPARRTRSLVDSCISDDYEYTAQCGSIPKQGKSGMCAHTRLKTFQLCPERTDSVVDVKATMRADEDLQFRAVGIKHLEGDLGTELEGHRIEQEDRICGYRRTPMLADNGKAGHGVFPSGGPHCAILVHAMSIAP